MAFILHVLLMCVMMSCGVVYMWLFLVVCYVVECGCDSVDCVPCCVICVVVWLLCVGCV